MTTNTKFNEGQYGFKPWMANLTMGILEIVMVLVCFLGPMLTGISAALSLDIEVMEDWDTGSTLVPCAAFLVWNLLVWFIKPLRTKFNNSEAKWNLVFIALIIISTNLSTFLLD